MQDESLEDLLDYFHRFTACGNPFLQEGCYNHSRLASNRSLLLPAVCCLLDPGRSRSRSGTVVAAGPLPVASELPDTCTIGLSCPQSADGIAGSHHMPEHIYTIAQGKRPEPLDEKHTALPPLTGTDNVLITFGETDATAHIEAKR